MYVKAQFQYSKVRPLKDRIYNLLEEQRKLQRDVTNMQLDKDLEYPWCVSQMRRRRAPSSCCRADGCVSSLISRRPFPGQKGDDEDDPNPV